MGNTYEIDPLVAEGSGKPKKQLAYSAIARGIMVVAILVGFAWAGTASIRNFAIALLSLSILVMAAAKFHETGHRRRIATYWQKALKTWDGRFPSDHMDELKTVLASAPSLTLPTMLFYSVLVDRAKEAPLRVLKAQGTEDSVTRDLISTEIEEKAEAAINRIMGELPVAALMLSNEHTGGVHRSFGNTLAEAWIKAACELIGDVSLRYDAPRFELRFISGSMGRADTIEMGCELVLKAHGWLKS